MTAEEERDRYKAALARMVKANGATMWDVDPFIPHATNPKSHVRVAWEALHPGEDWAFRALSPVEKS